MTKKRSLKVLDEEVQSPSRSSSSLENYGDSSSIVKKNFKVKEEG